MPSRKLVLAFVTFWLTLGSVVFFASVRTFLGAVQGQAHGPQGVHLGLLAGIEAVAALLFLVPWTMRVGAYGLLATFAVAIAVHIASGEFPGPLLAYAAGTVFVLVHGPVRWSWIAPRSRSSAV